MNLLKSSHVHYKKLNNVGLLTCFTLWKIYLTHGLVLLICSSMDEVLEIYLLSWYLTECFFFSWMVINKISHGFWEISWLNFHCYRFSFVVWMDCSILSLNLALLLHNRKENTSLEEILNICDILLHVLLSDIFEDNLENNFPQVG